MRVQIVVYALHAISSANQRRSGKHILLLLKVQRIQQVSGLREAIAGVNNGGGKFILFLLYSQLPTDF